MFTNGLVVYNSNIVNVYFNNTIVYIIYNIMMCFDSLLYTPVQICMRRTP